MAGKPKFNLAGYSDETKEQDTVKENKAEEVEEAKPDKKEKPVQKKEEPAPEPEKSSVHEKTEEEKPESEDKNEDPIRTSIVLDTDLKDVLAAGAWKMCKGNKSKYINQLIRADYEANKEAYDAVIELLLK